MNVVAKLPRFYSRREVAEQVGVCTKTVDRWIKDDGLQVYRLRGRVCIAEDDLIVFLGKRRG
jgi:excisionase family DNA binding protein